MKKKLITIFSLALFIRLIALNQSLWLDEATSANVIKHLSYWEIISKFSPTDFHPPLYYLLLKFWSSIFGYSEIALRFPSVIFSLLTGYFVYKIGSFIKNENVGFWSAVFFLFNPLIVYYSQEARMYMMSTCLSTIGLYYFIQILRCHAELVSASVLTKSDNRSRIKFGMTQQLFNNLFLFNIFLILSFYTFYGSIFLILTFWIYFLFKKQYKLFLISFLIFDFAFWILFPLLYSQFIHAKLSLSIVANWSQVLGKANLKNLLLIPIKFTSGRISFDPKMIYYLISGIWMIGVIGLIIKGGIKNKKLLFIFLFPLFLAFVFSLFTPLLQYFRFLYLIPIMSLLLTIGLLSTPPGSTIAHPGGVLVGFLVFSFVYLLNPNFHREDWKSLSQNLKNEKSVYMIVSSSDPIKYYDPNLKINDLSKINKLEDKKINVIPYVTEIYGLNYRKSLENLGYKLNQEQSFRGLSSEEWIWVKK